MQQPSAHRTIYVTYRRSRFARIKLRQPDPRMPGTPASYTPELAMELLGGTCEIPEGKRALLIILREYRRALHDLASRQPATRQPP